MDQLTAVYYTDKSIAVYGNTKPWKEYLLALRGKYNGSLNINGVRQPGWIFSKNAELELMNFMAQVNSGELVPPNPSPPTSRTIPALNQVSIPSILTKRPLPTAKTSPNLPTFGNTLTPTYSLPTFNPLPTFAQSPLPTSKGPKVGPVTGDNTERVQTFTLAVPMPQIGTILVTNQKMYKILGYDKLVMQIEEYPTATSDELGFFTGSGWVNAEGLPLHYAEPPSSSDS